MRRPWRRPTALLVLVTASLSDAQLVGGGALVPGGGGRARSYGYVREPGEGFWVGGSELENMNGVYIRNREVPHTYTRMHTWGFQLFYENQLTHWVMALVASPPPEEWEQHWEPIGRKPSEWVIMDETGRDIVAHEGETILPGCCTRWHRVSREKAEGETQRASVSPDGQTAAAEPSAEAAVAADENATDVCSWRQTGGCDPDGPREPDGDKDCTKIIPKGASGFCQCAGGAVTRRVGCDHAPFTCVPACERAARAAAARAASGGGELSTFVSDEGDTAAEEEEAYMLQAELPWQVVMLGDTRRMRNIEHHNNRWWQRNQMAQQSARSQQSARAMAEAEEAAAAAAAGPQELDAMEKMREGQWAEAHALFELLLHAGEGASWTGWQRARVLARQAACLRRQHLLDQALATSTEAWKLAPKMPLALFERGAALLDLCQYSNAYDAFRELHRIDREWPFLLEWLVRAYAHRQREEGHAARHGPVPRIVGRPPSAPGGPPQSSDGGGGGGGGGEAAAAGGGGAATAARDDPVSHAADRARLGDPDHYACLGVTHDATAEELKRSYRKVTLAAHPDKPGGSEEAFARVADAYKVLSDERARRTYDEGEDIVLEGRDEAGGLRERIEVEFFPERQPFWPFGDPLKEHPEQLDMRERVRVNRARARADEWMRRNPNIALRTI